VNLGPSCKGLLVPAATGHVQQVCPGLPPVDPTPVDTTAAITAFLTDLSVDGMRWFDGATLHPSGKPWGELAWHTVSTPDLIFLNGAGDW